MLFNYIHSNELILPIICVILHLLVVLSDTDVVRLFACKANRDLIFFEKIFA
jgi:hypothetical protein